MRCFSILIVVLAACAIAQAQPQPQKQQPLADFETDVSSSVQARSAQVEAIKADDAPHGKQFLRIHWTTPDNASIRIALSQQADFEKSQQLAVSVRIADAQQPVNLRWVALDEAGHPILHCRFEVPPAGHWTRIEEPLGKFRWDTHFVAGWNEVKFLELRPDAGAAPRQLDLDDVRLTGRPTKDDRAAWLLKLAFADRPIRQAQGEGFLVATDAADAFSQQDLNYHLQNMRRIRAFLARIFGTAVRRTDDLGPVSLLIFADEANDKAFFDRLGQAWRAQIGTGSSQGFTVQDIATAGYRKDLGVRRPVYLHESVHAIAARDLRILTADDADTPIQEGLANYIQICVYPQSLSRKTYVDGFANGIDASGNGFFKPLEQLFAARTTTKEYAQVASFVGFLIEKDQPLLRDMVKGLASDQTVADVLKQRKITWPMLQTAWLDWGRKRFNGISTQPVFDTPPEFR